MFGFLRNIETASLPKRVQNAVRDQEMVTERLISWFQLFVVVTLGALYMLGPKPEIAFDIIPWALLTYLVLTVIRIVWSHRTRLPNWSVIISAFFDIALLMALIWSFHLRYDQPPSFYLKAPTLLYVF
ncbi:MAG: adenylate/guanylate cyclase domain-containing protein, partial [Kiloniellales bacterium]|nr:adenylate/guanylate cyclase domain-containing protein [Kiloniellales bacterium]